MAFGALTPALGAVPALQSRHWSHSSTPPRTTARPSRRGRRFGLSVELFTCSIAPHLKGDVQSDRLRDGLIDRRSLDREGLDKEDGRAGLDGVQEEAQPLHMPL